jgi:glycosyltransferase involved in cell wall biosynthesis
LDTPRISIVTPSFNQGQFLEDTILSVIGQHYPNLEYIVLDGGSSDNSIEIIKKYEKHLAYWVSEKDNGQSSAINRGFNMASGDILAWLNSDDMYLPGTLAYVASHFDLTQPQVVFGNCLHINEENFKWAWGSDVKGDHETKDLLLTDYIIQPSCFFGRAAWQQVGLLDESLVYGFDWEWFIRAKKAGVNFQPIERYLSVYRIHGAHKSGTGGERRFDELARIYGKHVGEKYQRLFSECSVRRKNIQKRQFWIHRFRLSKFEGSMLKLNFPRLFRGFREDEVSDMMTMIRTFDVG